MPVNKETREMVARPELKDPLVQWDPADPSENVDVMDLQDPQAMCSCKKNLQYFL